MPSDRPPPEPPTPGSDPTGRKRTTGAVRDGTLVFALVLAGFVAYALGGSATYRATAVVSVEPVAGPRPVELPKPSEATDRLRRAALDPTTLAALASEEHPVPPDSVAQASARLSNALSVESTDGRRFTFGATATTPERAQHVVNQLAEQSAKRAAQALDPEPAPRVDPGAKAKAALLDFLAAHPGIASEPEPTPVRSGPDPLVLALRAERIRIEQKLANPGKEFANDNPYDDPRLENPESLRRRLKEIDNALDARSKPKPAASGKPASSPQIRAEWQRLLRAASETKSPEPAATPEPRLRVTLARAGLPQVPIEPDRPRIVLLGVLLASIAGVLAGFLRSAFEARAYSRYGITTGKHPTAPMPQTTLRIPREQLPKPVAPKSGPLPTPVPEAPPNPAPMTPIPPAPIVPGPITPIPPAPLGPAPMTPIPPAPIAPVPITTVPPPVAVLGAIITPIPPQQKPAGPLGERAPGPEKDAAAPTDAKDPLAPVPPMVVAGPVPIVDGDGPPTTLPYPNPEPPAPEPEAAPRTRGARRITQIYGTPPPPTDLQMDAKALRTTQAYGSPPVATTKEAPSILPYNPTPIPAEVLPPHKNSLRPSPMIPLARTSSVPPAVVPSNRSAAPLAETGYSYVRTPVPEGHAIPQTPYPRKPPDSIPQTPRPRNPSPPPRTAPYGTLPPVQPRPPSDPPAADPNRPRTPTPPPPELKPQGAVIRTHPVLSGWRPDPKLDPGARREIAAEILTLAVDGCLVIGITAVRGLGNEKSRTAVEVAFALSEAKDPRILLVEGDFHFPQIQNWLKFEVPLAAGFSQQLRSRIQGTKAGRWHVVECLPSLHVLAEGVMRSPGLLLSNQFEQAMRDLRSYYDIIVIDAPLAPSEADGQALADVVDGVVVLGPKARASEIAEVSRIFSGKKLQRALET